MTIGMKVSFQITDYKVIEVTNCMGLLLEPVRLWRKTKNMIERQLFELPGHSKFEQFLNLLNILNRLMEVEDKELLHQSSFKNQYTHKDHMRLKTIYQFVDSNYQKK